MSSPARTSCAVTGSPSATSAAALPRKGAVEKYASGPRSTEMTQRHDEQHQTQAVADEAHAGSGHCGGSAGKLTTSSKTKGKIERTRNEAFELDNLQGIGERDGQIIVKPPGETGAADGERTYGTLQRRRANPRQ